MQKNAQMKFIFQIFHFAYKIQQNFTFSNGVKRLKLHQVFDGVTRNFSDP